MRIGELAREAGTTPRTVRYYEEIGLLAASGERSAGEHREYTEADGGDDHPERGEQARPVAVGPDAGHR